MNVMMSGIDPLLIEALDRIAVELGVSRAELLRSAAYGLVYRVRRESLAPMRAPRAPPMLLRTRSRLIDGSLVEVDEDGLTRAHDAYDAST